MKESATTIPARYDEFADFYESTVAEPDFPAAWAATSPEKDPVPVFLATRCRRR